MKKIATIALAAVMTVSATALLASCGEKKDSDTVKVGLIALHDSNSTYDKNFIDAMTEACANKGAELLIKTGISETTACYDAAADLVDQGCDVVFADSFGHESFILQAAKEFEDVQFCHATGTQANGAGQANFHDAFASIYEGRYLAGVAAGMKLVEMYNNGELVASNYDENGNIKIGYVGAYTYAEVISGYTSFFLGARSVLEETEGMPSLTMEVTFTGSWYDEAAEKEGAQNLIQRGAALISQHADSMGAPSACEAAGVPNVSYNGSTEASCPNTFIVSSRINWIPYFEYMIDCVANGTAIDTDWCGTIDSGSVVLTEFGSAAAEGTAEKVAEVQKALQNGSLSVFDTSKFTVTVTENSNVNATVDENGRLISYLADVDGDYVGETEVVANGVFQESKLPAYRSAPYFDVLIDNITLLNAKY